MKGKGRGPADPTRHRIAPAGNGFPVRSGAAFSGEICLHVVVGALIGSVELFYSCRILLQGSFAGKTTRLVSEKNFMKFTIHNMLAINRLRFQWAGGYKIFSSLAHFLLIHRWISLRCVSASGGQPPP
jgi:hypothetical protein